MALTIPPGYSINSNGIYKIVNLQGVTAPICYTNIEISSVLTNLETGQVYYDIIFDGKIVSLTGEEFASKKGMLKLAGYGVKITEKKANDLSEYLNELLMLNTFPLSKMYSNFGWKGDDYFLGDKLYTITGLQPAKLYSENPNKQAEAIVQLGTVNEWIDAVSKLMEYANQRFTVYVGVCPLILKIVNVQSFVSNFWGDTSKGKTTMVKVAASIYGNPHELIFAGGATKVGVEYKATQFCDMPVCLDDIQNFDKEMLSKIIYDISSERGKLRGNKHQLATTPSWRTVGIFTGEAAISDDATFGGMDIRVIEKKGGLGITDTDAVNHFEKNAISNYGIFAPLLIEYILQNKNAIVTKHEEHKIVLKRIVDELPDTTQRNIANRLSNTFSAIMTAGYIFEEVYATNGGIRKNYKETIKNIFVNDTLPEKTGMNYTSKGLNFIRDWIESNKSYFLNDGEKEVDSNLNPRQYKVLGNIENEYIDIIPKNLNEELKRAKFSARRLFSDFKDMGIIITDIDTDRTQFTAPYIEKGGKKLKVYRFKIDELFK